MKDERVLEYPPSDMWWRTMELRWVKTGDGVVLAQKWQDMEPGGEGGECWVAVPGFVAVEVGGEN